MSTMEETIRSYDTFILESAEIGMYGRATLLFHKLVRLYHSWFSNVSLRIVSPLKSCNGKMSVKYAVIIYGVSFMHPCVSAVYTEVCGAEA